MARRGATARPPMTPDDYAILQASATDINLWLLFYFDEYFLNVQRAAGLEYAGLWDYQWDAVHAQAANRLMIAGRGTGKTWGFTLEKLWKCHRLPGYEVMWLAPDQDQANTSYERVLNDLVYPSPKFAKFFLPGKEGNLRTPYPKIRIQWPGTRRPASSIVWRHLGDGGHLRGLSFDDIHVDEVGMIDGDVIDEILRPCLRGFRPDGTRRDGRISFTGTPQKQVSSYAEELWDKARDPAHDEYDPQWYMAWRVSGAQNPTLDAAGLRRMFGDMTDEQKAREMRAEFPKAMGLDFSDEVMELAWRPDWARAARERGHRPDAGQWHQERSFGVVRYQEPYRLEGRYVIGTDPGQGNAPARNAGAIVVFDVAAEPARLAALSWVSGDGSYYPWQEELARLANYFEPELIGVESTGPQKGMTDILSRYLRRVLTPVDMGGRQKDRQLNAARLYFEFGLVQMARLKGLYQQMRTYDREQDGKEAKKLQRQDLVMAVVTALWVARADLQPRLHLVRRAEMQELRQAQEELRREQAAQRLEAQAAGAMASVPVRELADPTHASAERARRWFRDNELAWPETDWEEIKSRIGDAYDDRTGGARAPAYAGGRGVVVNPRRVRRPARGGPRSWGARHKR